MLDQRDLIFFDTYNVRWRYIYAFMCRRIKMKRKKRRSPCDSLCTLECTIKLRKCHFYFYCSPRIFQIKRKSRQTQPMQGEKNVPFIALLMFQVYSSHNMFLERSKRVSVPQPTGADYSLLILD